MGIPSYFSFLIKNHSNIVKKLDLNINIDNLYLDSNSIIYDSLRKIINNYSKFKNVFEFEKQLITLVCFKIEEYILETSPNKRVFIAFDGVAPVAKLEQQRNRRHKSSLEKQIFKKLNLLDKKESWNKSAITPGTEFMKKLNKSVASYFKNNEKKYKLSEIIFSGSDKRGEGEHKIFEYIRNNAIKHKQETTIIYGLDADLIMLSLNHLRISKHIYLYREAPEFIGSINSDLKPDQGYLLDINELSKEIVLEMNNYKKSKKENEKNKLFDYIFLCFFLGNDFLPHFPSVNIRTNGIQIMLNAYKEVFKNCDVNKGNLTNGKKIYWKNVYKLIEFLSENEYENLMQEYKIRDKWEKRTFLNKTDDEKKSKYLHIPIKNRTIEKYINPYESGWQKRYYEKLFKKIDSRELRKDICMNYLEGLEWVINYYSHNCIDWTWHYKYNYPPLFEDLKKFTPRYETTFIKEHENSYKSVSSIVQLAYVLPRDSLDLLGKYRTKLLKNMDSSYSKNIKLEWAFCKYIWESHVDLCYLDLNELKKFLNVNKPSKVERFFN